jgi:DNA polymerase III delta prime subunit
LRGAVEALSAANDFVMTANEPARLSDAIKSRFLPVKFDFVLSDEYLEDLVIHLWSIAAAEGYGDFDRKHLEVIVRTNFPDIRKMIKTLQYEIEC